MRFAISFAAIYYYICIIYSTTTNANNEKKETKRIIYLLRSILLFSDRLHFISFQFIFFISMKFVLKLLEKMKKKKNERAK